MARTMQTARKSAMGKSPRRQLPTKLLPESAKKKAIKKKPKIKKATKKKPKVKKTKGTFGNYIYRVLQQIHPGASVSSKAMSCLDSFVKDLLERLASEASKVAKYNKKKTLSEKEIQTSTRLLLPGELSMHAISEGKKAVTKFNTANK
uniref:Histone H2A/H2B/H3 domain-containing protein n=1 Tax=Panagrolaimus davidi TaxID=227884 RepID=A0A914R0G2_9BILA